MFSPQISPAQYSQIMDILHAGNSASYSTNPHAGYIPQQISTSHAAALTTTLPTTPLTGSSLMNHSCFSGIM